MDLAATLRRVTVQRPVWWRVWLTVLLVILVIGAASRRGWGVGVVAAVVYGALLLGAAFAPDHVRAWSRRHPVLDGSFLGPLAFLAAACLASWPLWVCALVGAAGVLVGAVMGRRRQIPLPDDQLH